MAQPKGNERPIPHPDEESHSTVHHNSGTADEAEGHQGAESTPGSLHRAHQREPAAPPPPHHTPPSTPATWVRHLHEGGNRWPSHDANGTAAKPQRTPSNNRRRPHTGCTTTTVKSTLVPQPTLTPKMMPTRGERRRLPPSSDPKEHGPELSLGVGNDKAEEHLTTAAPSRR